jgi:hypothetical protein
MSKSKKTMKPQPDNREQKLKLLEMKDESWLALATNPW